MKQLQLGFVAAAGVLLSGCVVTEDAGSYHWPRPVVVEPAPVVRPAPILPAPIVPKPIVPAPVPVPRVDPLPPRPVDPLFGGPRHHDRDLPRINPGRTIGPHDQPQHLQKPSQHLQKPPQQQQQKPQQQQQQQKPQQQQQQQKPQQQQGQPPRR